MPRSRQPATRWVRYVTPVLTLLLNAAPSAHAINLLQAYDAARGADATLHTAQANFRAEAEREPQARAQLYPSLSLSLANFNNQLHSESPGFLGQTAVSDTNYPSSSKSLSLRQPLWRPQLTAGLRQARAQVADAQAQLDGETNNLAVRVCGAYFEALLALEQQRLVQAQIDSASAQRQAAELAFAAGSGIRTDIDEAQAQLDTARALEVEARQQVQATRASLQDLIATDPGELVALATPDPLLPQPEALEVWVQRAQVASPQLRALQARLDAAGEELARARAGHQPTLDLVAQWSDSRSESVTNSQSRYVNKQVGFQLNLPLYAGGYVSSQVRMALALQERAQAALDAGTRDLRQQVQKEHRAWSEGLARVQAQLQALRSARQLQTSARKSFAAGSRTRLDILTADQRAATAQRDLAQSRLSTQLAQLRLKALAGLADRDALAGVAQVQPNPQ